MLLSRISCLSSQLVYSADVFLLLFHFGGHVVANFFKTVDVLADDIDVRAQFYVFVILYVHYVLLLFDLLLSFFNLTVKIRNLVEYVAL